ncbi:hypothetical protein Rhow_007130 [Rhodococcus wratislaviensis]|uniref:Uncharacterized protein n=1 Tax=Rhodococcus wratislaviensis TaxID=44752 RepID=A0A402CHA6_RHOWR|nr:hypothetical protein Rhow_007130 [Rhodococcus wratislaviensis]
MWTSRERQAPRRGGLNNHPYAAYRTARGQERPRAVCALR